MTNKQEGGSDIVEMLREMFARTGFSQFTTAADEIERLRERLAWEKTGKCDAGMVCTVSADTPSMEAKRAADI